jgi:hypothetical protein
LAEVLKMDSVYSFETLAPTQNFSNIDTFTVVRTSDFFDIFHLELTNSVAPEPEGSSPYLQQPVISPYPEPTGSTLHPQPVFLRSILITSSHLRLGLPSGLFPSGFPTNTLYTFLSHACHMPRPPHSPWLGLPNISGDEYKLRRSSLYLSLWSKFPLQWKRKCCLWASPTLKFRWLNRAEECSACSGMWSSAENKARQQ